ncbi:fasciclin domain-containing protein [Aestuariibaculum suncheonense]|uniref:Fasciclin domain-containing protein n=1 Tax=Aestuariibaculum suncheonense TaxID=1028745 RepID=A0A8J6QE98_9FLAO|nr:fasciclin domain-containing protein [Aestuariibaculum suncheonense]MBD0834822.1 fasciclin domain-containing protein [Aestuariibaculum suncheonense]
MKIIINKYSKAIIASLSLLAVVSCSDPWDDHAKSSDENLKQNLAERLTSIAETSEFGKLLTETGYDRVLANTKSYTVWAPTNEAIAAVPASELDNLESKKRFVSNHIALTAIGSVSNQDTVTVQMLSNKYLEFIDGSVMDGAAVVIADKYTSNGLYHIVSSALVPKSNIWEYIKSMNGSNAMSTYLLTLDEFNIYQTDSIAKATAEVMPGIYSDSLSNSYLKNVYNLNNEKNKYTFFLLEDEAFNTEVGKLEPYLIKSNADSTTTYASYFNVRDFAFHKSVAQEQLPDTLVSRFGVKVPIDKDNIVEEVHLSNGVLYVMSTMDVPLETRLLTTKIEGERPTGFSQSDKRANTYYREKEDLDGVAFEDIMVQNHGVPLFSIYYRASDLYSTTYKVYWRVINDIQSNTFQQRLRIGGWFNEMGQFVNEIATLPYTDVVPNVYDEVYIGEFYIDQLGSNNNELISLIAANSASNGVNTLSLDYIKLVPVIK